MIPTERASGVPVVQPLLQARLVEDMAARELVNLSLGIELGQTDGALFLFGATTNEHRLVLH